MNFARLLKLAFSVAAIALIVGALWYVDGIRPVDAGDTARVIVDIPTGARASAIAKILQERGVIRSARAFALYLRLHGAQDTLKAGSFVLRKSFGASDVTRVLTQGHGEEASVTIPEGFTVADIDKLLTDQGIIERGELVKCAQTCDFNAFPFLSPAGVLPRGGVLEGYLFPDTYFVLKNEFEPKPFLDRLLTTFQKRVIEPYQKDIDASGHSLHDIVTMASLIEEESRKADERPVVAGILWKRLEMGMSLGVDAAVRYAVGKQRTLLTKDDLDIDSPYNLRKRRGLPPGPITNPSLSSIQAALHPTRTDFLYYLHDPSGQIHYAVTNDEHNANRAKYLP